VAPKHECQLLLQCTTLGSHLASPQPYLKTQHTRQTPAAHSVSHCFLTCGGAVKIQPHSGTLLHHLNTLEWHVTGLVTTQQSLSTPHPKEPGQRQRYHPEETITTVAVLQELPSNAVVAASKPDMLVQRNKCRRRSHRGSLTQSTGRHLMCHSASPTTSQTDVSPQGTTHPVLCGCSHHSQYVQLANRSCAVSHASWSATSFPTPAGARSMQLVANP
jgi:hypothetical protein